MSFSDFNAFIKESILESFNITRIDTEFGIFRISGLWDTLNVNALTIISIEIMGTDGWVLLNQTYDAVTKLIIDLIPILQLYLFSKDK
ncbi:hypothetical protein [Pseudoalteromonas sp. SG44-8]|uniref:hypothetical protein n=1 Tax=Pseudoalteromonas sp. SG44-8 TaxID=2760958 RepID=UPI002175E30C|nr:hypothetical protein [Pseudoalteromonas sp. SG44-8]